MCPRRDSLPVFAPLVVSLLLHVGSAEAQVGTVEYHVLINGVLATAPNVVVSDNGPDDNCGGPFEICPNFSVTSGGVTISGSFSGGQIPPPAIGGLYGRFFTLSPCLAEIAPGVFPPTAAVIDLVACYKFQLVAVPAPNIFIAGIDGWYGNAAGHDISFAGTRYVPGRNVCQLTGGDPSPITLPTATNVAPPVFFVGGYFMPGFGTDPVVAIGGAWRFTVNRDGDFVFLPGSSTAEAIAGPPIVSHQSVRTDFGDNILGQPGFANGSELDVARAALKDTVLVLFLGGNLESNFNKLEIFFDTVPGGQNRLRGDNPDVDFDGLNRMGDDGSGNGLTFDASFEPDYWISLTGGDIGGSTYRLFANYAELNSGGGGSGAFLGGIEADNGGDLTGGTNPHGIKAMIVNSNTAGVTTGCDAGSAPGVLKGVFLSIPTSALGNTGGSLRICAFVSGSSHDYVSNQMLGPLPPGTCNLGDPRNVNLASIPGDQFFSLYPEDVSGVATGPAPESPGVIAWPNPFSESVSLFVRGMARENTVEIFDLEGRRVRRLPTPTSGPGAVVWDGRRDDGRVAAAGIYLVRVSGDGVVRTVRVVRLR